MNKQPLVSAILPIYNPEKEWLEKAIHSVLEQTYGYIEIVIVNDGSEKDLDYYIDEEILSRDNIRTFSQENQGFTGATNTAIEKAEGKYIAPIGQDDIWRENKIEKQVQKMENNSKEFIACFSQSSRINKDRKVIEEKKPEFKLREWSQKELLQQLAKGNFLSYETAFVRKSALVEVNLLNEDYKINSDLDLWGQLAEVGQFLYIREILTEKRQHEEQGSYNPADYIKEAKKVTQGISSKEKTELDFSYAWSIRLRRKGQKLHKIRDKRNARRLWIKSLRHRLSWKTLGLLIASFTPFYSTIISIYEKQN